MKYLVWWLCFKAVLSALLGFYFTKCPCNFTCFYPVQVLILLITGFQICLLFLNICMHFCNFAAEYMTWQWRDLETCELKCVLHILSPTEDAGQQRRSFSVVLLERLDMAAPSSSTRAGGTLDSLPGALDGFTEPNTPNSFGEDEGRKVDRQKDKWKHNGVVLTL